MPDIPERVIEASDRIRDELEAASLIVHHTGKDTAKGPRGSNALFAAADTVIAVVERVATVDKVRDGTAGEQFPFDLEVVEQGQDQDGDKVTTCVVVPTQEAPQQRSMKPLSGVPSVALSALQEAIAEHGRTMPGTSTIPPNVKAVTLDQWRTRFALRYGKDESGSKRDTEAVGRAFRRGREVLLTHHVCISDPYCWLTMKRKAIEVLT